MPDTRARREEFAELSAELLREGSTIQFRARGRSMAPLIRDGDVLTVEPATLAAVRVGDVVLHRLGGQLAAHRVVGRRRTARGYALETRGDALSAAPDLAWEEDLLGRVIARERDGKVVSIGRGVRRLGGRLWVVWLAARGFGLRLKGAGRRLAARLSRRP